MMQQTLYLFSSPCAVLLLPMSTRFSSQFSPMGRKVRSLSSVTSFWLFVVVFFLGVGSIHLLLESFRSQSFPHDATKVTNEDYMGLDGEEIYLPLWCSTCALVGTSGHILNNEYGSEIDRNSCVFRLGFSPNRGRDRHVGRRTTARVVDSYSFFPFLKKPSKLVTGPFSSDTWILFDHRAGDISWYHRPLLSDLSRKHDTKFLWMTKKSEGEVSETLKKQVSNMRIKKLSALWYALKVVQDAGCRTLDVYGIPDHQICKRNMNVRVSSLYWDNTSLPLCMKGVDASFIFDRSLTPSSSFPSVSERRAFQNWRPKNITSIRFQAPHWPS